MVPHKGKAVLQVCLSGRPESIQVSKNNHGFLSTLPEGMQYYQTLHLMASDYQNH